MTPADKDAAPFWSLAGLAAGARAALPLMPGVIAFGATFGTVAAQKGFTLLEAAAMSAFVYAGLSQVIVVQAWPDHITLTAAASLALVTATVNARFILMGAAMRPWLGQLPAWQSYPSLFFTADAIWLMGLRYRGEGGADAGYFLGAALFAYTVWAAGTMLGFQVSAWLADPQAVGLDMVMPAFFAAMLVPAWRGSRRAIAWAVAGLVAVVVQFLFAGWWFVVAGAIAGSITGALIDESA